MQSILDMLFGLKQAPWSQGGQWSLRFTAWPGGDVFLFTALALLAASAGLWRLYRIEAPGLARSRRGLLAGLRLLAVLLALVMLLEPAVVFTRIEGKPSYLPVLVDRSASMTLNDTYRDPAEADRIAKALQLEPGTDAAMLSRAQLVDRLLVSPAFAALADNGHRRVSVRQFAQRLFDADETNMSTLAGSTALGSAIQRILAAHRGLPLAGVLLVSDGQSNAGPSPADAARVAGEQGVPVVCLAIGTLQGPRNVTVRLRANDAAYVNDTFELNVDITHRGMADASGDLVIERRRGEAPWQAVTRETISFDGALPLVVRTFTQRESELGPVDYRARIETPLAQMSEADDVSQTMVRIVRPAIRTLLVAGSSFPEYQFLRNALMRDRGVEVSTWLQSAAADFRHPGDRPIQRLPINQAELDDFDCVILFDPDPSRWPASFPAMLAEFVSKAGGGLVYIAGERGSAVLFDQAAAGDASASRLVDLLPVVRESRDLLAPATGLSHDAPMPWRMIITDQGRVDPIFEFVPDSSGNQHILENLPGMYWHFPVTRAKAGATVLARHGDPRMSNRHGQQVVMATHLFGPGRVLFIGFDSTYRWRYLDESYFDGFWARVVDRAGRYKQLGGVYPFRLTSDRHTYVPQSQVRLTAHFARAADVDAGLLTMHGLLEVAGQPTEPITLDRDPDDPLTFRASLTATVAGQYLVRLWPGEMIATEQARPARLTFRVEPSQLEYERPTLDLPTLQAIAQASNATVLTLDQLDDLPRAFAIGQVRVTLEDQQAIFDAPVLALLLVGCVIAEWTLRKKYHLA